MRTRRIVGALRIAVATGLLGTIVYQITDRVLNNDFDPWEYFSFFTIETTLMNVVVLAVGGYIALRTPRDTVLYTTVRMTAVAYAIVTTAVYNVPLRGGPADGSNGPEWPNELMHVWVPVILILDWLLSPGRPALRWKSVPVVLSYPVAWIGYTMIRGEISGREIYPYPFLDPATAGWGSVGIYIVGLASVLLVLAALAVVVTRVFEGRSRRR